MCRPKKVSKQVRLVPVAGGDGKKRSDGRT